MALSTFSSYFELFTAFNVAYAGSKVFREKVDESLLDLKNYSKTVEELKVILSSLITVTIPDLASRESALAAEMEQRNQNGESEDDKAKTSAELNKVRNLRKRLSRSKEHVESGWERSKINVQRFENFPHSCQPMYLVTTFFCFGVLLASGYEQFLTCPEFIIMGLLIANVVLLYNLGIIIVNLFRGPTEKPPKYHYSIGFVALIILAEFLYFNFCPTIKPHVEACRGIPFTDHSKFISEHWSIGLALFTGASAFIFHYAGIFLTKVYYRVRFFWLYLKISTLLAFINWTVGRILKPSKLFPKL